jgi:hypothetical protein
MPVPLIQTKKMPDATGVSSNGTATMVIPATGCFYESRFNFLQSGGTAVAVANMKSEVSNITLRVDGDLVLDATPTFLLDRQKFYGDAIGEDNVAGVIPIEYAKKNIRLPGERSQLALGTQGVNQIVAEFRLGTLSQLNKIEHYLDQTVEQRPAGPHLRINKFPQNFPTTGTQEIVTLPKEPGTGVYGVHIEDATGTIDSVTVIVDGNEILDEVPAAVQQSRLERYGRNPQTGYYHIDFCIQDELLGYLPMDRKDGKTIQDFRLKIKWSGAAPDNYNIYLERVFDVSAPIV